MSLVIPLCLCRFHFDVSLRKIGPWRKINFVPVRPLNFSFTESRKCSNREHRQNARLSALGCP